MSKQQDQKQDPRLKVVSVRLADLVDDPENARSHDDKNLSAIRESLVQFGQVEPLVVQRSSKRVIGGNGRLDVMRKLGWTQADAVLVDVDDVAARALALALNRTGELGRWKMIQRVHGAATAARYATSPIWGFGKAVGRGEGETWEDTLSRELQRWEPATRADIAKRIASDIDRHQRLFPGVPLPESEPHVGPDGVSSRVTWEFLLSIAKRGDTKGRKSVPINQRRRP